MTDGPENFPPFQYSITIQEPKAAIKGTIREALVASLSKQGFDILFHIDSQKAKSVTGITLAFVDILSFNDRLHDPVFAKKMALNISRCIHGLDFCILKEEFLLNGVNISE